MNGRDRNISQFRKLSAYIMQDNQLHGNLTVEEAMTVATNLKLSAKVSKSDKSVVVSSLFGFTLNTQINSFFIGQKMFSDDYTIYINWIIDEKSVPMNK